MVKNGLDGALFVQHVDLFYLSGTAQDAHLFVPVEGEPVLMVRKSFERAVEDSPLETVLHVKSLAEVKDAVLSHFSRGLRFLGLEFDVLPVSNYLAYRELFPETEIRDVSPLVRTVRMIKSPYELGLTRKAAAMNHSMFSQVKEILREGLTELEFAGLVEAVYRKNGHQGPVRVRGFNQVSFFVHIMSGSNLAAPSATPGPTGGRGVNASFPQSAGLKQIKRNEPIQIDYVAVYGGYLADVSRTFFLGRAADKFLKIHGTALEIQEAIANQGRPGTVAEELYRTALAMAKKAGLQDFFMGYAQPVPFVGHGIGLELDEWPVIGKKSRTRLKEGMVLAIEPKFILPGEGLAGIENVFVVTEHGLEKLTLFDDAIQIVG